MSTSTERQTAISLTPPSIPRLRLPPARVITVRSVPVVTGRNRMGAVQCAAWSAVASQPSRCDIARAQLTTARTWPEVSAARHSTDHG
jgi:hypothetical protein